jgi:hypothetical protein
MALNKNHSLTQSIKSGYWKKRVILILENFKWAIRTLQIYVIDKELQYFDSFIICVARFTFRFVLDKISYFVTQYYKLVTLHHYKNHSLTQSIKSGYWKKRVILILENFI